MTAPILSVQGLSKSFGGLLVTRAVDLDLLPGARVGLIGPNGAGKTTFVNLLTGFLKPDEGRVILNGVSIEGLSSEKRVRQGLIRTHQINTLLTENNARDNVALAIAERDGVAWRMFRYAHAWKKCLDEAQAQLEEIGIGGSGDLFVSNLPYGRQRLLEIAVALAMKPKVLLLDEPAAGIPGTETHLIHDALDKLPKDIAILVIEHDMEMIFRFAKEIVVLVQGQILTRGLPADVARDPQVKSVYLGKAAA